MVWASRAHGAIFLPERSGRNRKWGEFSEIGTVLPMTRSPLIIARPSRGRGESEPLGKCRPLPRNCRYVSSGAATWCPGDACKAPYGGSIPPAASEGWSWSGPALRVRPSSYRLVIGTSFGRQGPVECRFDPVTHPIWPDAPAVRKWTLCYGTAPDYISKALTRVWRDVSSWLQSLALRRRSEVRSPSPPAHSRVQARALPSALHAQMLDARVITT